MPFQILCCRLKDSPVSISTLKVVKAKRKDVIRKHLRGIGAAYIDTKGEPKDGRTIGPPCVLTCNYECQMNFNPDERLRIHKDFWHSTVKDKQLFYATYVKRIPKHTQTTKAKLSRRTYTFVYYFQLREKRLQVCQKFFLNTLNLSAKVVYRVFRKTDNLPKIKQE